MKQLFYYFVLFGLLNTFVGCQRLSDSSITQNINLDFDGHLLAKEERDFKNGLKFITNKTDSIARSGSHSLEIPTGNPYACSQLLKNVERNSIIKVSFWCYGEVPFIVLHEQKKENQKSAYYFKTNKVIEVDSLGWKKVSFQMRNVSGFENLKVYVWNPSNESAYIDDYSFQYYIGEQYVPNDTLLFKVLINDENFNKLNNKRLKAFEKGVLESEDDDYVKAKYVYMGDTLKGEMRLKGDWLDHLRGDKWSFRIKLKKKYAWHGMRTFSIQNPKSRDFLNEWVSHVIFKKEDVLTTRYGFINVTLNGKNLGVYAYEEHFDKHIVESNNRREGPIVKFSEEEFWLANKTFAKEKKWHNIPFYNQCVILPFKQNKLAKSPNLLHQFENAQDLMRNYINHSDDLLHIFDIDKLAKYAALVNLTKAYHGFTWHNQRFYFNPVLNLLEPIAYDGYTDDGIVERGSPVLGQMQKVSLNKSSGLTNQYFLNPVFKAKFYEYLDYYSRSDYISSTLLALDSELSYYESLIQQEYLDYSYNGEFLVQNANLIQKELSAVGIENLVKHEIKVELTTIDKAYDTIKDIEVPPYFVKAYLENSGIESKTIKVINNYSLGIKVVGFLDAINMKHLLANPITISGINEPNNRYDYEASKNVTKLLYTVDSFEDTLALECFKWRFPEKVSPRSQLLSKDDIYDLEKYTKGREIIIPSGFHQFDKPVIIPKSYQLKIQPGATLDFVDHSFLLSFSAVSIKGTSNNKINIKSTDGTSMGFVVLQADKRSELTYVSFDQLNMLDYKGWILTGAVTFFESDVDMRNVDFRNNRCEDALNTIRSDFYMSNCSFDNIFADAFDSDFCTGKIESSHFKDVNNDAMDFSGSVIAINDCEVINIGDKGVSGGEASTLTVNNLKVNNAHIAVASKDNSVLSVSNSLVQNSLYGFVAFSKKPEYGSASIALQKVQWEEVMNLNLVEVGSELIQDGDTIIGDKYDVYSKFY